MVELTLPKNSRITQGKTWPKPQGTNIRAFRIYRWNPDDSANPRIDTGGPSASLSLSFDESFIRGRDPEVVYGECLNQLSLNGQITDDPRPIVEAG